MKFQRMKKAYAKENEGEDAGSDTAAGARGKIKSTTKRKPGDEIGKGAKKPKVKKETGNTDEGTNENEV